MWKVSDPTSTTKVDLKFILNQFKYLCNIKQ